MRKVQSRYILDHCSTTKLELIYNQLHIAICSSFNQHIFPILNQIPFISVSLDQDIYNFLSKYCDNGDIFEFLQGGNIENYLDIEPFLMDSKELITKFNDITQRNIYQKFQEKILSVTKIFKIIYLIWNTRYANY